MNATSLSAWALLIGVLMSATLAKGLKLLEFLCCTREAVGITELAKATELNLSGVQRLLKTLVESGYVRQDAGSRKYRATLMAWEIGSQVLWEDVYYRSVHPILREAAQSSGFTAYFLRNNAPFATYFDKVEGPRGLTYSSVLGSSIPIGLTAAGLAIVSFFSREQCETLRKPAKRGRFEFSGIDLQSLAQSISIIRERRYATSESGFRKGVNSVAAPVWGGDGLVCGSIAVTGDENELKSQDFPFLGQQVVRWAMQASTVLGGVPYPQSFYSEE
ncbi:IclR family transcriptional regulator [Pollutimonas sp. H1-120]|uniref:IclR family transcriptional regulator n=1 Tax=Pollutimonas sp. H1-120 TaxID=3148824 RepID=UPI003B51F33D